MSICYRLTSSYRVNIWTRSAPDLSQPDTEPLKAKILALGRMFMDEILGFNETNKLVAGGLQSEVTFESHKVGLSNCGLVMELT
jgi:translation initiation factor 4E